jgi:hypothetical protein
MCQGQSYGKASRNLESKQMPPIVARLARRCPAPGEPAPSLSPSRELHPN